MGEWLSERKRATRACAFDQLVSIKVSVIVSIDVQFDLNVRSNSGKGGSKISVTGESKFENVDVSGLNLIASGDSRCFDCSHVTRLGDGWRSVLCSGNDHGQNIERIGGVVYRRTCPGRNDSQVVGASGVLSAKVL